MPEFKDKPGTTVAQVNTAELKVSVKIDGAEIKAK